MLAEKPKEPFEFKFLGLKEEYSETELEAALHSKIESFLLELGGNFTFHARRRWADAPPPKLRQGALDAPGGNPPMGLIPCDERNSTMSSSWLAQGGSLI
jgi:hypothetical protein